jgi:hypothetical protein
MPNHFHFFLKVNDQVFFEKGIRNFFISYSKAINKKHNRVGSLFQGRYKASEITTDSYYSTIVAYIHQNPVVAGLVKNMDDYKYSSYLAYILNIDTVLNKQEVLEWFGGLEAFIQHHKIMLEDKEMNRVF